MSAPDEKQQPPSKVHQVLLLLAGGTPMTPKAVADATGWTIDKAARILRNMWNYGYVREVPQTYVIADAGQQRLAVLQAPPQPRTKAAETVWQYRARMREERKKEDMKPTEPNAVIEAAKSVPNSIFSLGKKQRAT